MPKIHASFADVLDMLDAALVLLKKRQWFKSNVRGAVIGVEFTLGAAGDHYHAHAHMLAWSKWVSWSELGEQWTACLLKAAARRGVLVEFETAHGRAVVDVRLVTAKRKGKGTVSTADAIQETCKYIVKGSDFEKIPAGELCAVEKALRRRRMVETFGECNAQKGKRPEGSTYLDTQNITDGSCDVSEEIEGVGSMCRERAEGEREAGGRSEAEDGRPGESARAVLSTPARLLPLPKSLPLREVGAAMIRRGERELWLEMLRAVFAGRREWRRRDLARRFPYATFRTLDGHVWRGIYAPGS
jgi:hypothetical protein